MGGVRARCTIEVVTSNLLFSNGNMEEENDSKSAGDLCKEQLVSAVAVPSCQKINCIFTPSSFDWPAWQSLLAKQEIMF